ncbi:MAG: TetR/AcrR family transcriptional regulator C-terminal domain-containing protein, partial [Bacillota bacterium]
DNAADKIVEFLMYYAKYINSSGIDFAKKLYNTDNKSFINNDRAMFQIFNTIIKNGQDNDEIIKTMTSEEICNYLFIAARGVVFEWCLHDGKYNLESAMVDYFNRLVTIFKNK